MKVAIVSGSVYGTAEEVARHAVQLLSNAGHKVYYKVGATLADLQAFAPEALLTVTASTGMGELPDNLMPLYCELRDRLPAWSGMPAAVLALGDSNYEVFCGGGELVRELYDEMGLFEVQPMLCLDASETVTPETDAEPWLQALASALQS